MVSHCYDTGGTRPCETSILPCDLKRPLAMSYPVIILRLSCHLCVVKRLQDLQSNGTIGIIFIIPLASYAKIVGYFLGSSERPPRLDPMGLFMSILSIRGYKSLSLSPLRKLQPCPNPVLRLSTSENYPANEQSNERTARSCFFIISALRSTKVGHSPAHTCVTMSHFC